VRDRLLLRTRRRVAINRGPAKNQGLIKLPSQPFIVIRGESHLRLEADAISETVIQVSCAHVREKLRPAG
jgi:hypothetical protein